MGTLSRKKMIISIGNSEAIGYAYRGNERQAQLLYVDIMVKYSADIVITRRKYSLN